MNRAFILGSLLIVLLAAGLRLYHLGQRSLWLDEAIAANISRGTLSETLALTRGFHSAPIIDPLILYAVERVGTGPLAVRLPSVAASLLAVISMLCFVTLPSVDFKTATLSALMLSVAAAQVRYAQEVREYSLGVLYAAVLLYAFLSYASDREGNHSPALLYLALFVAPFVQYGLLLFSCSILLAIFLLDLFRRELRSRIAQIMTAFGFLALGAVLSYWLTLRYQWEGPVSYLNDYYWVPGSSILRFVGPNTHHLLTSLLLPGLGAALISVVATLVHLARAFRARAVPPLTILAFTSCLAVLVGGLLHVYPYGPIRQCLFLAPVVCLFASASLAEVADWFRDLARSLVFAVMVAVVIVSGAFQIRSQKPYAEVEDIQQVLQALRIHREPGDAIYIYAGAVPAVDFYVNPRDPHFMYGDFNHDTPDKYIEEISLGLEPDAKRFWIVFSHVHGDDDQRILQDLSPDWTVQRVLAVTGSSLYLASRRPAEASSAAKLARIADHTHDGFWAWNYRNARPTIR